MPTNTFPPKGTSVKLGAPSAAAFGSPSALFVELAIQIRLHGPVPPAQKERNLPRGQSSPSAVPWSVSRLGDARGEDQARPGDFSAAVPLASRRATSASPATRICWRSAGSGVTKLPHEQHDAIGLFWVGRAVGFCLLNAFRKWRSTWRRVRSSILPQPAGVGFADEHVRFVPVAVEADRGRWARAVGNRRVHAPALREHLESLVRRRVLPGTSAPSEPAPDLS
jgi:hypothetical protein